MNTYIIKYILKKNGPDSYLVASVTIDLENDESVIDTCKEFEKKGNSVLEIYNKSKDQTIYNYKKSQYQSVLL